MNEHLEKPSHEAGLDTYRAMAPEAYLEQRINNKIGVYNKLGNRHRAFYYASSVVSIIAAATVPVLVQAKSATLYVTILSLLVTVMVSFEKLFHFREHWRNYDSVEAFLKRERLLYLTNSGEYKGKPAEEAFNNFVLRVEEGIKNERNDTIEMRTKDISGS